MSEQSGYSFIEWSRGLSRTRRGRPRVTFVYFAESGGRIKIGCSEQPWRRAYKLSTGNANGVHILAAVPGTFADEKAVHRRFAHLRLAREWFRAEPELRVFVQVTATLRRLPLSDEPPPLAPRIWEGSGTGLSPERGIATEATTPKDASRNNRGGIPPDDKL